MGTDCKLVTEKGEYSLSRWYIFSREFETKKVYLKNEFEDKLFKAMIINIEELKEENRSGLAKDVIVSHLDHNLRWSVEALKHAGEKNMIVTDQDDEFFELKLLE